MARKIRLLNPRCAGDGHKGCNEKFRVNFDRVDTISRRIIKQRGGWKNPPPPREKERNGKIAREARQDGGRRTRRNCVAKKFSPVEEVTKEIMNGSDALVSARRKGWKGIKGGNRGLVWTERRGWGEESFGAGSGAHCPGFHTAEMKTLSGMNFFPSLPRPNWTKKIASLWLATCPPFFPLQKTLYPLPLERLPPTNTPPMLLEYARRKSNFFQLAFPIFLIMLHDFLNLILFYFL